MANRVARALLGWALVWGVALALAAWWVVHHEMSEMQDDSLLAAAEAFAWPLSQLPQAPQLPVEPPPPAPTAPAMPVAAPPAPLVPPGLHHASRFVWQRVQQGPGAAVLQASAGAPASPLLPAPSAGLSDVQAWRVHATPLPLPGQWLLVAQARHEREEAQREAAVAVAVVTLPMAVLGLLWLRQLLRRELVPLRSLSRRLASHDPLVPGATLGPAERRELVTMHEAVDSLSARLALRVARERAFTAHAAHALRTPLAGIDAQLAVALREAPAALQPRLQRVRDASGRLQRVLTALLALFRTDQALQRDELDLPALAARLPVDGLAVQVRADQPVRADADLVTAALLNLLDNALRHGARQVVLSTPRPGVVRVQDDGPGVPASRLQALRQGLSQVQDLWAPAAGPGVAAQADVAGATDNAALSALGLGLVLAEWVARAHGGTLHLPEVAQGFAVELNLGTHPHTQPLPLS